MGSKLSSLWCMVLQVSQQRVRMMRFDFCDMLRWKDSMVEYILAWLYRQRWVGYNSRGKVITVGGGDVFLKTTRHSGH